MEKDNQKVKGIIFMILSALFFALMSLFVRLLDGIPLAEKGMFRNLFALFVTGISVWKNKMPLSLPAKGRKYVILRAVLGTAGLVCNFYAISRINLADANILNKLSPFFTILFSYLFFKEKISQRRLRIIVGIFIGAVFVIKPSGENMLLVPLLIAALGGVTAGAAYACIRGATSNGVDKKLVVFYFSLFSTLFLLPSTIIHFVMPTPREALFLVLCGVCGCGGQLSITQAFSYAPSSEISGYDYTQVLFSAILGFILFGQVPDVWSFVGYAIIIGLAILDFAMRKKE